MRLNVAPSSGAASGTGWFLRLPSCTSSTGSLGGRLLPSVIGQNQHVALHWFVVSIATITGNSTSRRHDVVRAMFASFRTAHCCVVVRTAFHALDASDCVS